MKNPLFSSFSPQQLRFAIEYEMRFRDDPKIASDIAIGRLTENPNYYDQFAKMEKARITKYVRRESDGKGGWKYFYKNNGHKNTISKQEEYKDKKIPQTETPEFKKWFDDSKVVDKNGKPLIVYHGSGIKNLTDFKYGAQRGLGLAYFTDNRTIAEKYAYGGGIQYDKDIEEYKEEFEKQKETNPRLKNRNPNVISAYLSIKKPLMDKMNIKDIFKGETFSYAKDVIYNWSSDFKDIAEPNEYDEEYENKELNIHEWFTLLNDFIEKHNKESFAQEETEALSETRNLLSIVSIISSTPSLMEKVFNKYDGMIYDDAETGEKTYVVFNPYQIKSATNNNGNFNPNESDMTKARIVKYVRRERMKDGKYKYYYADGTASTIPAEKAFNVVDAFKNFFGLSDKDAAKNKIKKDYYEHKISAKYNLSLLGWADHLSEYFIHKDKWDNRFSGKTTETKAHDAKKDTHTEKKASTPSEKPKFNVNAMKEIYDLYGEKVEEPIKETAKNLESILKNMPSDDDIRKFQGLEFSQTDFKNSFGDDAIKILNVLIKDGKVSVTKTKKGNIYRINEVTTITNNDIIEHIEEPEAIVEPAKETPEQQNHIETKAMEEATPENRAETENILEGTPKKDFQKTFSEFLKYKTEPNQGIINFINKKIAYYQESLDKEKTRITQIPDKQKKAYELSPVNAIKWAEKGIQKWSGYLKKYLEGTMIDKDGKIMEGESYFYQIDKYNKIEDKNSDEAKSLKKKISSRENKERKEHARIISKAIDEGNIIPANVLKEYPEIVADKSKEIARPDINYKPIEFEQEIKFAGEESDIRKLKILDYTKINPKDVFLMDESIILKVPRPSYIPEMDVLSFSESGRKLMFDTVRVGKDKFIIVDKRYGVQPTQRDENGNIKHDLIRSEWKNSAGEGGVQNSKYCLMNSETMAATWDYYRKLYKANEIDILESRQNREEEYYNKRKELAEKEGREWNYAPFQHKNFKGPKIPKPDISHMSYSQGFLIQDFTGMKGNVLSLTSGALNAVAFNNYHETLKNLDYKIEDMKMQREYDDENNTFAKGEETSYGDYGLKNNLLKSHGVKVKRQNGTEIDDTDITKIGIALDTLYSVFGDRSEMAKNYGLKVSFAGDKRMHASKAVGLFIEQKKCLAISDISIESRGFTIAHEFSHFMDSYLGQKSGKYRFISDEDQSPANILAIKFRDSINISNKTSEETTRYYNRTCECFARAMEQYYAIKQGTEKELYEQYKDSGAIAEHNNFINNIMPLCEQFFVEYKDMLKAFFNDNLNKNKNLLIKSFDRVKGVFVYRRMK